MTDEIIVVNEVQVKSIPIHSLRDGLLGKSLEDGLQELIEQYPQIIPGRQIRPGSNDPPRFCLLCREMPVGSWSLDFLLVDHHGVPTLVEAKLVENPESRRAVIGQIIEYAANAAEAWSDGKLREKASAYWSKRGKNIEEIISEFVVDEISVDSFWESVENNLAQDKIRLIVATDELRPEIRKMIEFLNSETNNLEILGLEVKCYGESDHSFTIVPYIIGQSQINVDKKGGGTSAKLWTYPELHDAFINLDNRILGDRLLQIIDWAKDSGALIESRTQVPSFGLKGRHAYRIISVWRGGTLYCYLNASSFGDDTKERDSFVDRLNQLSIFDYNPEGVVSGRNSSGRLFELSEEEFADFMSILQEFCFSKNG